MNGGVNEANRTILVGDIAVENTIVVRNEGVVFIVIREGEFLIDKIGICNTF